MFLIENEVINKILSVCISSFKNSLESGKYLTNVLRVSKLTMLNMFIDRCFIFSLILKYSSFKVDTLKLHFIFHFIIQMKQISIKYCIN